MWDLEKFVSYLVKIGKVDSLDWLDTILRPAFSRAFIHLARAGRESMVKDSRFFEFLGVDFLIDEDLNIWLIEVNSIPQIRPSSDKKAIFLTNMISDLIAIEKGYLQSRVKRVTKLFDSVAEKLLKIETTG